MKLYIDTANVGEIIEATQLGIISGVTTNPSLIAKTGQNFTDVIHRITDIIDGPISAEIDPNITKAEEMVEQAKQLAGIHPNIVIKIPMCVEGLKACTMLRNHVKVNMTLIFSANQALLAANAGAAYVSPFIGRYDDIDINGMDLVKTISKIFKANDIHTEIIAASIRNQLHVTEAALAGADIATVPYKVLMQMINHPLTTAGIEKFKNDYNA